MNSSFSESSVEPFINYETLYPDGNEEQEYPTSGTIRGDRHPYDDSEVSSKLYRGTDDGKRQAIKINRTYYTKKILSCLDELSRQRTSVADSILHVQQMLNCMKEYVDKHYRDSFSSFVSTCYDALVFDDNWISLTEEQYRSMKVIFTDLNNRNNISYDQIDKSIAKLESIGLDTTPF
ncbi:MAG: hypothetical protein SD837_00540 [Candidatus Electrothrix scaldis]|nr:MAG: hypothetical protein SD837_00540 [Candidatus Electrothrix sp. GW3-3]